MTRNITSTPRVSIFQPRASNIIILLIDLQINLFQKPLSFISNLETGCTCSDANHPDVAFLIKWLLCYAIPFEVLVVPLVFVVGCTFWDGCIGVGTCRYCYDAAGCHFEAFGCGFGNWKERTWPEIEKKVLGCWGVMTSKGEVISKLL